MDYQKFNLLLRQRRCRAILDAASAGRKIMASASKTAARARITEIRARFGAEPELVVVDAAHAGILRRYSDAVARSLGSIGIGGRKRRQRIEHLVEKYRDEDEPSEPEASAQAAYPFPSVKMIAEKMKEEKEALRSTNRKSRRLDPELPSAGMFSGQTPSKMRTNAVEEPAPSHGFTPPRRSYTTESKTGKTPQPPRGHRVFGDGFVMFINPWSSSRLKP